MKLIVTLFLLVVCLFSCNHSIPINNIDHAPTFEKADQAFADVFKILDGTWKGQFQVLEDPNPKAIAEMDLKQLTIDQVKSQKYTIVTTIDVTQTYQSESPFFQRVNITDFYPKDGKTEKSKGVNKVQNGQLWCVVKKPNETIIHQGSTRGTSTIIWQSKQNSPQKVEYFQEEVSEQYYEILGYGYYDGDDLKKTPRLWFYGKYERQ